MLLKIEQRRRLKMPRGSQSHPLRCALDCMSRETWHPLCSAYLVCSGNFLSQSGIGSSVRCRAEFDVLWTVPRKSHVQQRHGFIDATLSSPTGIACRPPQCCCLTLVGARRMLLRWLNYNVLMHIDLYANMSLLSYM